MPNYKMVDADVLDGAMLETAKAIREKGGTEAPITWNKSTGYKQAIEAISGGGGLNFEVVGGETQPTNPKENMIWIDTPTVITKWSVSKSDPANPVQGDVWIVNNTSATYAVSADVLDENDIILDIGYAKQYVNGVWVEPPTYIFLGGSWVKIDGSYAIFEAGKGAVVPCSTLKANNGDISVTTDAITSNKTGSYTDSIFYTDDKIDVSEYNTLELTGVFNTINTNENYVGFGVMSSTPKASAYPHHTWAASMEIDKPNTEKATYIVDISNVTGAYYIAFAGASVVCTITDIRLRK